MFIGEANQILETLKPERVQLFPRRPLTFNQFVENFEAVSPKQVFLQTKYVSGYNWEHGLSPHPAEKILKKPKKGKGSVFQNQ